MVIGVASMAKAMLVAKNIAVLVEIIAVIIQLLFLLLHVLSL